MNIEIDLLEQKRKSELDNHFL